MEKINLVELLKDCPEGMELDCTMYDDIRFYEITDDPIFPIRIKRIDGAAITLTKHGCYADSPSAKCVIFPKGKTTWKGFHRPFEDGDILSYQCTGLKNRSIYIYRHHHTMNTSYYVALGGDLEFRVNRNEGYALCGNNTTARLATEEEKAKLFDAIKANGYKWDEGTKTLEKLGEQKFKNGDIIICENHWGPFISIFKENVTERNGFIGHCVLDVDDNELKVKDSASYFNEARLATEEEKEQLFRAIEKNGYKWNQETKTLEKLSPNKFDLNTLVPFESRVLVRNDKDQYWIPAFWGCKHSDGYTTTYGWCKYCIPYEGNKHLLDSNKECDKFFRTWEKTGD